jgi:phospholipid/cholesterol/gamma-HCH transport system substrate-binding protein
LGSSFIVSAEYKNVSGLQVGSLAKVSGFQIGVVKKMTLLPNGNIKVDFNLDKGIKIPKSAIAYIVTPNPLSNTEVKIEYEGLECTGKDCLKDGDKIKGEIKGILDGIMEGAAPIIQKVEGAMNKIDSLAKSVLSGKDAAAVKGTLQEIPQIVNNLKNLTGNVDNLVRKSTSSLTNTLSNLEGITSNINNSKDKINTALNNLAELSNQLKSANINGIATNANQTIDKLKSTIDGLQGTLTNANRSLDNLSTITHDIANSEGTLGKLIHDEEFANQLYNTLEELETTMQDLRLNPARYTTILRKKRPAYKEPTSDPAEQNKK